MKKLRGPKDSKVNLGVVRRNVIDTLLFTVTRDKIPLNTLDAGYMIAPEIGYIHLDRFGATSAQEVRDMLKKLKKEGMEHLILDLTLNGGGYLGAAIEVANEFLEEGELIVYTEGRATPRSMYKAKGGGSLRKGKVVVLVDEYSASAAEIVSGAIQDQDRGTIIGRRTFGKGLVQRPIELPDGSMIRLTVSHYYTPAGRCIQKPYEKGKKEEYDKDLETRFNHGELTSLDSIHLDSTKVYKTLKEGRIVYGGGGIMPDIFVPLDTMTYTPFFRAIRRYNLVNDASLKYVDRHRNEIKKAYPDFEQYMEHYEVPTALTDSILAEAKRKKVEAKDSVEAEKTLDELRFTLKALIAYDLWERSEYFRIINTRSDIVKKALEVLGNTRKNKKKICQNKKSL
jgi:carboxyl-terminal processing protease